MQRQHVVYGIVALLLVAFVIASPTHRSIMATSGSAGFSSNMGMKDLSFQVIDNYDSEAIAYAEESMYAPSPTSLGTTAAEVEQRIIKTAAITLEVDAATETATSIADIAKKHSGFVESSAINEAPNGGKSGWVTIRVPVDAFETVMAEAKALADKVESESTNAQDVTEQFTDLEARLHAAQAQEAQYLLVLTQAKSVGDILAVQEHLADVRAEIESMQGQINYLENRTAYSSISFSLIEESRVTIPAEKYELSEEIKDAVRSLILAGQKLLTAIIWVVIVGGPFTLLAYAGYRGYRAWERRR